jgi:hypothetical protein
MISVSFIWIWNNHCFFFHVMISRHAEKYVRRGRLDWPEGATSRESIKAVTKLPRLQVCFQVWSCKSFAQFLKIPMLNSY